MRLFVGVGKAIIHEVGVSDSPGFQGVSYAFLLLLVICWSQNPQFYLLQRGLLGCR